MDIISATVDSLHVGRARGRRVTEAGPRGLRFAAGPRLGFHVLLTGQGWLITGSAPPVPLRPGDVVFTPAGTGHGVAREKCALADLPEATMADLPPSPAPVDFEFLCGAYPLERGQVPALLRHLPDVVAFPLGDDQRTVVELLKAEYTQPGPGSEARRAALIDLLLVAILRRVEPDRPSSSDPGIAVALREIHGRPERAWTVQQLGAVAGMSRTTFVRRFTADLGSPPMRYLTDWRLRSGARLLRQSDAPLSAVARQVGYATEFAFATAFRRKYGVPPGRYRHGGEPQS